MAKRNIFLRVALLLLVACAVLTGVFTSTPTFAKYIATATSGSSTARAAKFSFEVRTTAFEGKGGTTEIAQAACIGTTTPFTIPLFDYEYSSVGTAGGGTLGTTSTVKGKDDAIVIAPGTGHHQGSEKNNPNIVSGSHTFCPLNVTNNSEVTVRYKIEYDPASSLVPVNLPIYLRGSQQSGMGARPKPGGGFWPGAAQWVRIDLLGPTEIFPITGTALADGTFSPWVVLEPGDSDPNTPAVTWIWSFTDVWAPDDEHGTGVPGNYVGGAHDALDTDLGKNHYNDPLELKFKLTVEQVD